MLQCSPPPYQALRAGGRAAAARQRYRGREAACRRRTDPAVLPIDGRPRAPARRVLVIDVGGSHVKCLATGATQPREFKSWRDMTAGQMAARVMELVQGWSYDVVTIGYPGAVDDNKPAHDPHNLGPAWRGFDFERACSRGPSK